MTVAKKQHARPVDHIALQSLACPRGDQRARRGGIVDARGAAGMALVVLGIGFNIPYAALAMTFGYPAVLRLPTYEILVRFAAGGAELILTWYAFMLSALLMAAAAILLSLAERQRPAATMIGFVGLLAGLLQAIGLSRWVFVVPELAAAYASPATTDAGREAIEATLLSLHAFAGVAIGEHLGQLLTAAWAAGIAAGQAGAARGLGLSAAVLIVIGTGEGLALALGHDGTAFGTLTVAGFLLLSAWLVQTGARLLIADPLRREAAAATRIQRRHSREV